MALQIADMFSGSKLPKVELIPPREADVEGVFRQDGHVFNGRIIYTERVVDRDATKATKRVKTDPQGNEIWKKSPGGEPLYPIYDMKVQYKTDRYILNEQGGRNVKKVRNFEPTPEELRELARKDAEANFFREFVAAAVSEGLSAAELVQRMKSDIVGPGGDPDAVDIDVTERAIAEVAAELGGDTIERTDDEDSYVALAAGEVPELGAVDVAMPEQPKRKRRGKD